MPDRDSAQVIQATRLIRDKRLNHNQLNELNQLLPLFMDVIKSGTDLLEFRVYCEGLVKNPQGGQ